MIGAQDYAGRSALVVLALGGVVGILGACGPTFGPLGRATAPLTANSTPANFATREGSGLIVTEGPRAESATVDSTETLLVLTFVGSPALLGEPCGEDYHGSAQETDSSVTVVIDRRYFPSDTACGAAGVFRTTTLQLIRPLGHRTLIDTREKLSIPISTPTTASVTD